MMRVTKKGCISSCF